MRRLIALGVASLVLTGEGVASGQEPAAPESSPTVVSETIERPPKRVENVVKFTPEPHPSWPTEVRKIARLERERWGGPSIVGRIWCESDGKWWVVNGGGYAGLLQIGGIWGYLWSGAPRGVRIVKKRQVRKPIIEFTEWSNGVTTREQIGSVKQKRVRIRKGKLPAGASPLHGWAAIRVGQRAVSGDGPSTGWSCGL
jgi:hypothetical protein